MLDLIKFMCENYYIYSASTIVFIYYLSTIGAKNYTYKK